MRKWKMGNAKWEMGNGKLKMGKWTVKNEEMKNEGMKNEERRTKNGEWRMENELLGSVQYITLLLRQVLKAGMKS